MKKITLLILMAISCFSMHAQIANTTGLPGDNLIYAEDMRFYRQHPALPVSGASVFVTTVTSTPAANATIPVDGLAAGQLGYARPANNYPALDANDARSFRVLANTGSANHDVDVWIVIESVDLSAYDGVGGSKYFTFSTRTSFREDGGTNIDDDNSLLYSTNFVTGTDPTGATWLPLTTTPVGSSAAMGADGVFTTQTADLSSITAGTQFAIALRRQTSATGPAGGAFSSTNNRNGTFFMTDPVYTGTPAPVVLDNVSPGDFSTFNTSATAQANIFDRATTSIDDANFTNTTTTAFDNIYSVTNSVPRLVNGDLAPVNEGYKFEVGSAFNPIVASEVRYKLANGTSNKGTVGGLAEESFWKVQGSNDDTAWDDLTDPIGMYSANSSPNTGTVALNITKAYRYYRFVLASEWTPNQNFTALQEISFTVASLWTGTTDNDWSTITNWNTNAVPTSHEVIIPSGLTNFPTISTGTAVATSNITIESEASLIAEGTSTVGGTITYKRNLSFTAGGLEGWHLVGSPVTGETYDNDYLAANDIATGTLAANRGIATYNNATGDWVYHQTGASGTFGTGAGYSMKTTKTRDVSFTGTMNTDPVDVTISTGAGTAFNLISNPFTSYVNAKTFLELAANSAKLTSETIWVWNPGTKNYDTKLSGDVTPFQIAPGQGFFVQSNYAEGLSGDLTFEEGAQSHQTTDTFLKSEPRTEVQLNITDGDLDRYAKLYYIENATKGFDNGLDGETFSGVANKFDVFTQLVGNNVGKNYQVQSLPNQDLESMIISVGLKAEAGKEITFSAEALNLPSGIKVFLEDRENNTFTRLDESGSEYKITLASSLDGVGRFYLHTKSNALSTEDVALENISIYKSGNNLRIVGLQQGNASVKMFNILGKNVMQTSFNSSGVKNISLPNLATGVYIVQLTTDAGRLNKKIILE